MLFRTTWIQSLLLAPGIGSATVTVTGISIPILAGPTGQIMAPGHRMRGEALLTTLDTLQPKSSS